MRIERYLRERQRAISQFRHGVRKAYTAYVAVRWYACGKRKLTSKMKRTVARDLGQAFKPDVIINVRKNIFADAAEPRIIESKRGGFNSLARSAIAMP